MHLIDEWKKRAEEKGVSMAEVARVVGVDISTLGRWKPKLPKSLRTYFAIEKELNKK